MKLILDDGGEGVILRAPNSDYVRGRSDLLIKLKAAKGDREGLVVRKLKDGSCVLQLPNGVRFTVQAESVRMRYGSIREGDVVTFSYESISRNSVPMNPIVLRPRSDLTWREVLLYSSRDLPRSRSLNEISHKLSNFSLENPQHWITKKRSKMRRFCEKFAESKNLDPSLPATWYSLARELAQLKEASFILLPYKMSVIRALVDLFPNIGLKESEFAYVPRNYWDNVNNRREFFCRVGKHFGFDPLIPENWYSVSYTEINRFKGVKAILRYDKTIAKALVHLFPEIGFQESKFPVIPVIDNNWRQRRNFFVEFARHKGFDPRIPDSWYSVSLKSVLQYKGGYTVLQNYRGRLKNALLHLFPNLGLDRTKFYHPFRSFWMDTRNQREFLSSIFKEHNIDPLKSEAWSASTLEIVKNKKGGKRLLREYDNHLHRAIQSLFFVDSKANTNKDMHIKLVGSLGAVILGQLKSDQRWHIRCRPPLKRDIVARLFETVRYAKPTGLATLYTPQVRMVAEPQKQVPVRQNLLLAFEAFAFLAILSFVARNFRQIRK